MNELKLPLGDAAQFERSLAALGGTAQGPTWYGNWYLETTATNITKIMQVGEQFTLLRLVKQPTGFAFVGREDIADPASFRLAAIPEHDVLHKTVTNWMIGAQSVDVLRFDDIGDFACVNYDANNGETAMRFITEKLGIARPDFIEVPFNVLKRRKSGMPDFDPAAPVYRLR